MAMRLSMRGDPAEQFRRDLDKYRRNIEEALARTARKVAAEIKTEIFKDIQSSGNFGKPWKSAVKVETAIKPGRAVITIRSSSSPLGQAAKLFEHGGDVHGQPLLWIPLNDRQSLRKAIVAAGGAVYVQSRAGKHLLIGRDTHRPIAIGVESITQQKRFHIHDVVERVARQVLDIWRKKLAKLNK